ncbi:hypothetical protein Taro_002587, partial [Colocasia esculenta]|nr:hypothetical protein [Colocasia esculenta]
VNDTVGTLALSHYHDEDTVAAVIIGTGTNACYVERTDAIIKCQGLTNSGSMVINIEWGNFWSSHLPRTPYDIALDDESPNHNDQARYSCYDVLLGFLFIYWLGFEKMISGMYLGDIVRRVLCRMAEESDIFGDAAANLSTPFALSLLVHKRISKDSFGAHISLHFLVHSCQNNVLTHYTIFKFRTPVMAAMHEDGSPDLREVARMLEETLQIPGVPLKTRRLVVRVCDAVTRRAARLAAAGIVGILKKIGRDGSGGFAGGRTKSRTKRTVVAIEGGLYAGYNSFREYLNEAIIEILGEEVARNVVLRTLEDGSGIGAALLAASCSQPSYARNC